MAGSWIFFPTCTQSGKCQCNLEKRDGRSAHRTGPLSPAECRLAVPWDGRESRSRGSHLLSAHSVHESPQKCTEIPAMGVHLSDPISRKFQVLGSSKDLKLQVGICNKVSLGWCKGWSNGILLWRYNWSLFFRELSFWVLEQHKQYFHLMH